MSENRRGAVYCLLATMAVLVVVALGALFLIAPVWQPGYHAVGVQGLPAAVTNDEAGSVSSNPTDPIELNTATQQQLMQLSGVGVGKAAAIMEYRQQNGEFSDVSELAQVPGISQKMVESWRGQIYIAHDGN